VQVFANQGATNARWVWCPNVASSQAGTVGPTPWNPGSGTIAMCYPGDAWVDYVGLDGDNKYTPSWRTFQNLFQGSYNWMYQGDAFTNGPITTTKSMIICEVSSYEDDMFTSPPQTKGQFIADIQNVVANTFTNVIGVINWFDCTDALEWPTTSSPAAVTAWNNLARARTGRVPLVAGITANH
jgi:hypothetical protein